jgi:flagellar protein FliJ
MSKRSRLGVVLRARQAQEDVAKGVVQRAHAAANTAAESVQQRERDLDTSQVPTGGTAYAVVAALAARQSLAAAVSVAKQVHSVAVAETAERTAELAEAAKRRQVMEKLMDRYRAEEFAEELAAEQLVLDEIAITARQRLQTREGRA